MTTRLPTIRTLKAILLAKAKQDTTKKGTTSAVVGGGFQDVERQAAITAASSVHDEFHVPPIQELGSSAGQDVSTVEEESALNQTTTLRVMKVMVVILILVLIVSAVYA